MAKPVPSMICFKCNTMASPNGCPVCQRICAKTLNEYNNLAAMYPVLVTEINAPVEEQLYIAKNTHVRSQNKLLWLGVNKPGEIYPDYQMSPYARIVRGQGRQGWMRNYTLVNELFKPSETAYSDQVYCPECGDRAKPSNCWCCQAICRRSTNEFNNIAAVFPGRVNEIYVADSDQFTNENLEQSRFKTASKNCVWSNKQLYWQCNRFPETHKIFNRSIATQLLNNISCDACERKRQSSKQEMRLFAEARGVFPNALSNFKISKFKPDVVLTYRNNHINYHAVLEWDGFAGHNRTGSLEKDVIRHKKIESLSSENNVYRIFRLRDDRLQPITFGAEFLFRNNNEESMISAIHAALIEALNWLELPNLSYKLNGIDYINDVEYRKLLDSKDLPEIENSLLAEKYHKAKTLYNLELNNVGPDKIFSGSNDNAWFNCEINGSQCEGPRKIKVKSVTRKMNIIACKWCTKIEKSKRAQVALLEKKGVSFADQHPERLHLWHDPVLLPQNISSGSSKKVLFKCEGCGEINKRIVAEIVKSSFCSLCRIDRSNSTRKLNSISFAVVRPDLAPFWVPTDKHPTAMDCSRGERGSCELYCRHCENKFTSNIGTAIRGTGLCSSCSQSNTIVKTFNNQVWLDWKKAN